MEFSLEEEKEKKVTISNSLSKSQVQKWPVIQKVGNIT